MRAGFRWGTVAVVAALGVLAGPLSVRAQDGTITASLTVLLPAADGTGLRGLDFGTVTPGVPAEVLPSSPLSGWFQLTNINKNDDVRMTFALPTALTPSGGGPGLPIYFDGEYARSCGNGCQTHVLTPTPISPTQLTADAVHVRPGPPYGSNPTVIDVYIGGRVDPAADQQGGSYQGTIQLTFAAL